MKKSSTVSVPTMDWSKPPKPQKLATHLAAMFKKDSEFLKDCYPINQDFKIAHTFGVNSWWTRNVELRFADLPRWLQKNLERKYRDTFGSITIIEGLVACDQLYMNDFSAVKGAEEKTTRKFELRVMDGEGMVVVEPFWNHVFELENGNEVQKEFDGRQRTPR